MKKDSSSLITKKVRLKRDFDKHKKGEWVEMPIHIAKTLIAQGWAVDYSKTTKKK